MTDDEIRASVFAQMGESALLRLPPQLDEGSDGHEWRLGSFGFWKSSATALDPCPVPAFRRGSPLPTYRRGSLVFDLAPATRLEVERFRRKDGSDATAIVLYGGAHPTGDFAAWTLDEANARRVVAFLSAEIDAARAAAAERHTRESVGPSPA